MRYGDLEMFLCGLELTHLLPKFQVQKPCKASFYY